MTKLSANVVGYTKPVVYDLETPEELIAYCARVSSGRPQSEWGDNYEGLLKYCVRNKHWSVFDMADIVVEVWAPRDIARQVLRHQSCKFQELSQRYSDQIEYTSREVRSQDTKNRQNSFDDFPKYLKDEFQEDCAEIISLVESKYQKWRDKGAAKECVRVMLPEGLTMSHMMIKGSVRSWLHYVDVRDDEGVTQLEHVWLAREIAKVIAPHVPILFKDYLDNWSKVV